ncbi:hypothetical protein [Hydrogenimonas urashimensis]|uniref:hypothetical protein n=1 Tax=Hydrogenimonas urashimensis TaxID=2740515 RepID=UPI001915BB8B|nr:hypothetical protein [Hydrogenimonas urashimensis]
MDKITRRAKEIDNHVKQVAKLTGRSHAEAIAILQVALSMSQTRELKAIAARLDELIDLHDRFRQT